LTTSFYEKNKLKSNYKIQSNIISGKYKKEYGTEFIPLASFSYCSYRQMYNGFCCRNALPKHYKIGFVGEIIQDKYTFAILVSQKLKRVVISLSGTKDYQQLAKQGLNSNLVSFGDPKYKMYILSYFNTIYTQVKEKLKPELLKIKSKYFTYQYIFTGHGLGGAMSTIFALDSAMEKYVNVSANSPVLLNYASPRVGNYIFASYVMKRVPRVYRIVREGDPIISVPPCSNSILNIYSKCKNKLRLKSFKNNGIIFKPKSVPEDKGFWHIGGLINYTNDMSKFTDCGKIYSENHPKKECNLKPLMNVSNHASYLDKTVYGVCQGARRYLLSSKLLKKLKLI
jgi:hypothetical protein